MFFAKNRLPTLRFVTVKAFTCAPISGSNFAVSLTRGLVLAKLLKTAAYGLQHWSIIQNV